MHTASIALLQALLFMNFVVMFTLQSRGAWKQGYPRTESKVSANHQIACWCTN